MSNNYIGNDYYNDYVITADDMMMNVISYQFANNYTKYIFQDIYILSEKSECQENMVKMN